MRLPGPGSIEVICGSMFSGKSEELIRRLTRAKIARQRVQVFKPRIDDRYSEVEVVSHGGLRLTALAVASSGEILERTQDRTEVVGIDEAQFFDPGLVDVAGRLADLGKRVLVAGLDQDYLGRPFEPMPALMAAAEDVTKMRAICMRCGAPASRTQRLVASNERVVVGAAGLYEARCRRCFEPGVAPVDGDREAHPGGAGLALDRGAEVERRAGRHADREAQPRPRRGDDGPPGGAARVTEMRGRLDAAQMDGGARRLLHDRGAVEGGGQIGDDLLETDLRRQAERVAAARREEAEEQCPRAARHERAATIA